MKLDPWLDAQALAQRLAQPHARLIVLIGALDWCQKCRDHLPVFERRAANAPANESHVWLDVEEHTAFLGLFVPEDLPLQLVYESGRLMQALVLRADGAHTALALTDPGIHTRLCTADWAGA